MSARGWLLVLGLVLGACASAKGHSGASAGPCPTLIVENWNFADMVLWSDSRKIGIANGLTTTTFNVCWLRERPPVFDIHAIGGALDFRMSGVGIRMAPTSELRLVIGSTAGGSWVIGSSAGFGVGRMDSTALIGAQLRPPMGLHIGIWYDVAGCLGIDESQVPDPVLDVDWVVADSIKTSDGRLAYGSASLNPVTVVIENGHWFNPTVISHEAVHIQTRDGREDSWGMYNCVMPSSFSLPERWWR